MLPLWPSVIKVVCALPLRSRSQPTGQIEFVWDLHLPSSEPPALQQLASSEVCHRCLSLSLSFILLGDLSTQSLSPFLPTSLVSSEGPSTHLLALSSSLAVPSHCLHGHIPRVSLAKGTGSSSSLFRMALHTCSFLFSYALPLLQVFDLKETASL